MRVKNLNIPSIYLILIAISLVLFVFIEWINPKQVSWQTTFSPSDKIPYGTYVLKKQLGDLFPGKSVDENSKNYFELTKNTDEKKTLVIVNDDFFTDEAALNSILNYVDEGNQVFISANYFMPELQDTLGFSVESSFLGTGNSISLVLTSDTNETHLKSASKIDFISYFEDNGEENQFSYLGSHLNTNLNFIRFDIGEGSLFLHSTPIAFTNYYILNGNSTVYVEKVFSELKLNDVIWDNYVRRKSFMDSSQLKFIKSSPTLRSAYYIGCLLLILFMLFYGKRRQRVVPVFNPLKNSSLDFADTISKLYLQQNKHKNIADKQIRFFMDYVRLNFHLQPNLSSNNFKKTLILRSGKDENQVNDLLNFIKLLNNKNTTTAEELLMLNQKIENFKKNE